jgi:hypothetical protein
VRELNKYMRPVRQQGIGRILDDDTAEEKEDNVEPYLSLTL